MSSTEIYFIIGLFLISLLAGFLSVRAISRFMDSKIEQWSFEYQVFGFGGALVFVFGMIYSISMVLSVIVEKIYYMLNT